MNEESLPFEKWKGYYYEGWVETSRYLISNYGRIKSLKQSKEGILVGGGKLSHYVTIGGRSRKTNGNINRYLHRVVAELFIPKPEGCDMVIHVDYDYKNNKASNLQWVDKGGKSLHQSNNPHRKVKHNAKLTETEVIRLKRILHNPNRKTRYKILARQFGVTEMQLHRIKSGENWGHVKY